MHPRSDAMLANPSMTCGTRNSPLPSRCDATAHGQRRCKNGMPNNHMEERESGEAYAVVVDCDAMQCGARNCKRSVAPLSLRTRFPMCALAKMWPHVALHNVDPMRPFQNATPTEMTLACCPPMKQLVHLACILAPCLCTCACVFQRSVEAVRLELRQVMNH